MKFLVATDFSERSDRAVHRAAALGKSLHADSILLIHVIDTDEPERLINARRPVADQLLQEQASFMEQSSGIHFDRQTVLDDPIEGVVNTARGQQADLVIIGSHRKRPLRDLFLGTTAERLIRTAEKPTLMVKGMAEKAYRQVLVAVDCSAASADALKAAHDLGFAREMTLSVIHVYDTPAEAHMRRSYTSEAELSAYLAKERDQATNQLTEFLDGLKLPGVKRMVKHSESSVAVALCEAAKEADADLMIIGTQGRSGVEKAILGSVAERVLHSTECDVLAVPPRQSA